MASNDNELFKDKIEVSLDGRQIFYLFFSGAVIASLVFVLGIMVGRRVEARTVVEAGPPASDPLAALDRLEGGQEFAFPSALRGKDEEKLGSIDQELAARNVVEAKAAKVVAAKAQKAEATEKEALPSAPQKQERAAEKKAQEKSGADQSEPAAKKNAAVAKADEGESKAAPEKKKGRKFTLQVGSFQDRDEAEKFFRNLEVSDYKPFMVEAEVPGKGKYYRVRVGGYGGFDEALEAKAKFEDSQHIIAYVTRIK